MAPHTTTLRQSINEQRSQLAARMAEPMAELAAAAALCWGDREAIDALLVQGLPTLPNGKFLYAIDSMGVQNSSNISQQGLLGGDFGRDRSYRPYVRQLTPGTDYLLSEAYISERARRPSITAMQAVRDGEGSLLGYIGVDFDLRDLPLTRELYDEPPKWMQIKGDPSIRSNVFLQTRTESRMDRHLDDVMGLMEELIVDHGVFQINIHFSSSRATVWQFNDPYRYRLLDVDLLTDPDICLAYPRCPYPSGAVLPPEQVRPVLDGLSELRLVDETIYLRSASLNTFNGMVSLTFSCDGSHYLPFNEFLDRSHAIWAGQSSNG